jgi:hypothetical protein
MRRRVRGAFIVPERDSHGDLVTPECIEAIVGQGEPRRLVSVEFGSRPDDIAGEEVERLLVGQKGVAVVDLNDKLPVYSTIVALVLARKAYLALGARLTVASGGAPPEGSDPKAERDITEVDDSFVSITSHVIGNQRSLVFVCESCGRAEPDQQLYADEPVCRCEGKGDS